MGLFRKSPKTRDSLNAFSPQEQPGAGRQVTQAMYTSPSLHQHPYQTSPAPYSSPSTNYDQAPHSHQGGMTATLHNTFNSSQHNDDFDDAASYHSISSNPGMSQSAGARPNEGSYTPMMTSRFANASSQSRSAARPNTDSHYGSPGDENMFRSPGLTPNTAPGPHTSSRYLSGQFAQSPRLSGRMFSPASVHSSDRMSAMHERPPEKPPMSAQELGEECFQKAVQFHEQGDLVSATAYFKRAADKQSPLGMLFYGLSLRHGWGCQANETMAFVFLQKAGEIVVPHVKDMDPTVAGMAKEELAMAIYELGQSYRHGWGVSRNKKTAAYYFEVAADLGDADAQSDLAACYEKGDGVKRNMKRAAHYYRLAHKQGVELFGTSWIFKKKYNSD
ncbi:hypothetical protein IW147_000191 [Coemansia sp. RSA 720]|nr:hypothetical protein IW147_000191 [Coemansia sp. RSA 720]